jgi:hypothetical protein
MRLGRILLTLSLLLLIGLAPLPAGDRKDTSDRLPPNIEWRMAPLYATFDVQSLKYAKGQSVTWQVVATKEIEKFKGITAKLTDEDTAGVGTVQLEFTPKAKEYKKGDKIEVVFRFPDRKAFERTAKVVFTLNP